jgi:hypothetical protein
LTARLAGPIHAHVSTYAAELPYLGVLRFAGPDAIAFLQGQVSNDTRRLSDRIPMLAAYSTAQGRVVAVLHLVPHSSGVLAILPREIALPTLERMRKFVLRAKVAIEYMSWSVAGAHDVSALELTHIPSAAGDAPYIESDDTAIARLPDGAHMGAPRYWVLRGERSPAPAAAADLERGAHAWRLADIRAGLPQIYAATSELFVAQMLNLDRLDAISFTKGCYTGQEIIARAQHLGRIKRRMFRLRLPAGTWSIGQTLRLGDGRSGRLTELAPADHGFEALAVLSLDAAAADSDPERGSSEAIAVEQLSLPYTV